MHTIQDFVIAAADPRGRARAPAGPAPPPPGEVLGELISRNLSDKQYEKRKQAAQDIESKVREALNQSPAGSGKPQVLQILECLKYHFLESDQAASQGSHRKGGLIGFASVALGVGKDIGDYLEYIVPPVLEVFKDKDARVQYYACEALYNISKAADKAVLAHFPQIFDGLCKLYAGVAGDVRDGAQILDRTLKDIVTSEPSKFNVGEFVDLLATRPNGMIYKGSPYVRQLILGWICLLLGLREKVDMVSYLPQYFGGLLDMLKDQVRDVRHNADATLQKLLQSAIESPYDKAIYIVAETVPQVVKGTESTDPGTRLCSLCWLHSFIELQMKGVSSGSKSRAAAAAASTEPGDAEQGPSKDSVLVDILPEQLSGMLRCIDDGEEEIVRMATEVNAKLLNLVQLMKDDIPVEKLVDQLLESLQARESLTVRTACLQWICMLLAERPSQMLEQRVLRRLFDPIFESLDQKDDEVVVAALRVLAQIMEGRNPEEDSVLLPVEQPSAAAAESRKTGEEGEVAEPGRDLFTDVVSRLLRLFAKDRNMLETRGRIMIRQLCGHLDTRKFYIMVARAIKQEADLVFAQQLVQTFNWILLTAVETKGLREELLVEAESHAQLLELSGVQSQDGGSVSSTNTGGVDAGRGQAPPLFLLLLEPWFNNPVSALALCLWSQQYLLASELTARFAAFEPTLDLLRQLDQLVHLLESPVFSRLRLRLLEPRRHPELFKCMLGLAMLLPQAGAFNILRERLQVLQSGLLLAAQREVGPGWTGTAGAREGGSWWAAPQGRPDRAGVAPALDVAALLNRFDNIVAQLQS